MPACPTLVRDELRRAAALYLLNGVHSKPGMKKQQQEAEMGLRWKGEGEIDSHSEKLYEGKGPYTGLYERDSDGVLDPSKPLYLKPEFTSSPEQTLVVGRDITQQVLLKTSFTGTDLVGGPYLYRNAQRAMTNIRKALALATPLVDEDGNPKESGKTRDSVLQEILLKFNSGAKTDDPIGDDDEDGEDDNSDEATTASAPQVNSKNPKGWFPGYFAFVLWGPLAPKEDRLDLFSINDPKGRGVKGRANHRQRDRDDKKKLRKGDTSNQRGMTLRDRIQLTSLEQRNANESKERKIIAANIESTQLTTQLEGALQIAKAFCPVPNPENQYWKTVIDIQKKQGEVAERLKEANKDTPEEDRKHRRLFLDGFLSPPQFVDAENATASVSVVTNAAPSPEPESEILLNQI